MHYKSISKSTPEAISEDFKKLKERVSIGVMLEVKAHLGHNRQYRNPEMISYIYGTDKKTGNDIIHLEKSVPLLNLALQKIVDVVSNSGRVLFIGTKTQASDIIKREAMKCGQYYVNLRWPSGMLTNWNTVSKSIKKLIYYEKMLEKNSESLSKKEILSINRKKDRIEKYLGGVREMGGLPSILFVIDPYKEHIAIKEAKKLRIPVVAVVDTNCSLNGITYPIPGNDDLIGTVQYYCSLICDAALAGIKLECEHKKKSRPREDSKDQDGKDVKDNNRRNRRDDGGFRSRREPNNRGPRDDSRFGGRPQAPRRFDEGRKVEAKPAASTIPATPAKEPLGDHEDE